MYVRRWRCEILEKIGSKGFKAKFTLKLLKMDLMSKLDPDLARSLFSKVGF